MDRPPLSSRGMVHVIGVLNPTVVSVWVKESGRRPALHVTDRSESRVNHV